MANISGFMEITMRPVKPLPRFDLIKARFPLCSLCWSVMLARLGSPKILVRTGCGKTAKSWSELSGIYRLRAICLYRVGETRLNIKISRGQGRYDGQEVRKKRVRVAGTGVLFWYGADMGAELGGWDVHQ